MPSSIFIVDSSPAVRRMVEQISTPEGFEVIGFQDGPAALDAARRISPALIIADYHLDNMTFSGFCKEVHKLEHLTETYLISLINAADRPDENHLRTLGVKAFLKKPFQSDDLLDLIKSLKHNPQNQADGGGLKRRVWPPTSTTTDADNEAGLMDHADSSDEPEDRAVDHRTEAGTAASANPPAGESDEAAKGLFEQLLHSMTERTEKKITDLIPQVIERAVATHVRAIVQKELREQLEERLSQERLVALIQPLFAQELPRLLQREFAACEPLIRNVVSEAAGALIKESLDHLLQEQSESGVRKYLPDAVREHLGAIDLVVTDAVRQAAAKQAPLIADDVVRSTAEHSVEEAVQRIVPELAEQHIKAELKRLTTAE